MALPIPFLERIERFVEIKLSTFNDNRNEFLKELIEAGPEIKLFIADTQTRSISMQVEIINEAIKKEEVHAWVTPELWILGLNQLGLMLKDPVALALFNNDYKELSRFLTKVFVHGFVK